MKRRTRSFVVTLLVLLLLLILALMLLLLLLPVITAPGVEIIYLPAQAAPAT
jgi:hypothetical protein